MKQFKDCDICKRRWKDDCVYCLRHYDVSKLSPKSAESMRDYFVIDKVAKSRKRPGAKDEKD